MPQGHRTEGGADQQSQPDHPRPVQPQDAKTLIPRPITSASRAQKHKGPAQRPRAPRGTYIQLGGLNLQDFRHRLLDHPLNSVLQSHLRHWATTAGTGQSHCDLAAILINTNKLHVPTIILQCRTNRFQSRLNLLFHDKLLLRASRYVPIPAKTYSLQSLSSLSYLTLLAHPFLSTPSSAQGPAKVYASPRTRVATPWPPPMHSVAKPTSEPASRMA